MIEQDTIKLLRECDAGIKMGVASIDDVLPHVQNQTLKKILTECKRRHERLVPLSVLITRSSLSDENVIPVTFSLN